MKMVILETDVTVAEQRLGQLRCDVGNVFEVVPSKTHETIWKWLVICRDGPVLGRNGVFGVFECFRGWQFVFLACYNVLKLFEMLQSLGFIRWKSSLDFGMFLAFEEKLR